MAHDQDLPLCLSNFICYPKCMDTETKSVLVYVGLARLGDSLLKLPFVRSLREAYPGAHITWIAGKDTSVYAGIMSPFVQGLLDEVIENAGIGLSPQELLRRPLSGRYFDIIFDINFDIKSRSTGLRNMSARTLMKPMENDQISSIVLLG